MSGNGFPAGHNLIEERRDRRRKFSELLVVVLVGVAFEQMAHAMAHAITWDNTLLLIVFFTTIIRFLIGDHFHLQNEELVKSGNLWFYDSMIIGVEMVLLIFLGSACNVAENDGHGFHFVSILLVLCILDLLWIITQHLTRGYRGTFQRKKAALQKCFGNTPVPWEWAILNVFSILIIVALYFFVPDIYSRSGLMALAAFSVIAFVIDVYLTDFSDLI